MNLCCPRCREVNGWGSRICERREAPPRGPGCKTYEQKLIWALRYPKAATALRAATPLGEKVSEVRGPLLDVLNVPDRDTSLGAAAARALGAVKELATRAALATALECGPVVVRLAAVEILEMLGSDEEVVRLAAVVEAVNDREKIQRVLPRVREVLDRSLITLADVEIRMSPNSPVGPMGTSPARKSRAP